MSNEAHSQQITEAQLTRLNHIRERADKPALTLTEVNEWLKFWKPEECRKLIERIGDE